MLDKNSKIILKHFIDNNTQYSELSMCMAIQFKDLDKMIIIFDNLLELGCIKIVYQDLSYRTCELTNKGRMYFKIQRQERFNKYWFPILTSAISYILGLLTNLLILWLSK